MSSREYLAAALQHLMAEHPIHKSVQAVERATAAQGLKVGKSTVDRVLRSETPINIDYLDALASAFSVAPWELISPGQGTSTVKPSGTVSVGDAIRIIGAAMESSDEATREAVAPLLRRLTSSPSETERIANMVTMLVAGPQG